MTEDTMSDAYEERLGPLADEMKRHIEEADDGWAAARDLVLLATDHENIHAGRPSTEDGEAFFWHFAAVHGLVDAGDSAYVLAYKDRDGGTISRAEGYDPTSDDYQELVSAVGRTYLNSRFTDGPRPLVDNLLTDWETLQGRAEV